MQRKTTRRRFLRSAAAGAAGVYLLPPFLGTSCVGTAAAPARRALTPADKLRIGVIGVGNRGWDNLQSVAGEEIVAICDVDEGYLAKAKQQFPAAADYWDYRLMIGNEKLDAVVISTADHTHAEAAARALRNNLDVYCEKPLSRDVREARIVTELAREHGAVTQMGIQIHDHDNYRRVVEFVRSGALGAVREVHSFVNGRAWSPFSQSAVGKPEGPAEIPKNLHYQLWLGPVPKLAYNKNYHPGGWRSYWAFGNGTLGDMACHHMDLPFWALDLRTPLTIEAEGPPPDSAGAPPGLRVRYQFSERGNLPPVSLTWHDGNMRPEILAKWGWEKWNDGTLFVGEKGCLIANYDVHETKAKDPSAKLEAPPQSIPASPGHHKEWIDACKSRGATSCGFDYSGPLTEAVLLGSVAYRSGKKLEWNAERCEITNLAGADSWLLRPRTGDFPLI
jgi:predicted dehydrogenase